VVTNNSQHETPLDGMSPPQTPNLPNAVVNKLIEQQNLLNNSLREFNLSLMNIDYGEYLEDDDEDVIEGMNLQSIL
jgi:hypothetical protein